ncbi:MAG: NAD(P)-binding protein [Candidatus Methanomethylicus sp.]|nr:NAD(P)-binding protein [Candidatus Methanomethylicus sp.]
MATINSAEDAVKEASRCSHCNEPNCIGGCPLGVPIPAILSLVATGKFLEAALILRERIPLASVTGRLCPSYRFCEKNCSLGRKERPISFCSIERFLGDLSLNSLIKQRGNSRGSVLVVGGGPAGITTAHDLFVEGYNVDVWERRPSIGGWLRKVPPFRLPTEILNWEIERLVLSGMVFEINKEMGNMDPILASNHYEKIALTIGEPPCRPSQKPGVEETLEAALKGIAPNCRSVVINEGTDGAIDLARQLRQLKPDLGITINAEIVGNEEDAKLAESEGISIRKPSKLLMKLGALTIGGDCPRLPPPFQLQTSIEGLLMVNEHLTTSKDHVYAAGGAVGFYKSITEAMASGHDLAQCLMFRSRSSANDFAPQL